MAEQTDYYQQQLRSLSSKSKQDFIRKYKMYDEPTGSGVYVQVLTELTKAIADGNADGLNKLSDFIEYIGEVKSLAILRGYYNNASNPIRSTNLVILACKHNKVDMLKSIFCHGRVLDNLSVNVGNEAIAPHDKDETCHDAFYYAIRSGNVQLIDTLIQRWPGDYFATRCPELDEVLSKGYEELKLKNVPLAHAMEMFVGNKLINLRFYSNSPGPVLSAKKRLNNIRERVDLVLENIARLRADYSDEQEVDDQFVFITKFIAQNMHVLKLQMRSTYDRLPWEEIEFCVLSFVTCHVKPQAISLFYRAALNKRELLEHLEIFGNKLEAVKVVLDDVDGIDKLSELPKLLRREQLVADIVGNCPQFKELYNDYQQLRDIRSLEKINNCIKLAGSADPSEREGQLIMMRVLQVIGENLKNTLESPNLSSTTSELLLLSFRENTRKIIVDLRNSLSHAASLSRRTELEENCDADLFLGIQNDTKKVGVVVADILYNSKIKIISRLLRKIASSKKLAEIKEAVSVLGTVEFDTIMSESFTMIEHYKLAKLIKELSDRITDQTPYEREIFNKIHHKINSAGGAPSEKSRLRCDGLTKYALLKNLCVDFRENTIRGMQFHANQILETMTPKMACRDLKEIATLTGKIAHSVRSRMPADSHDDVNRLFSEIVYIAKFETGHTKYMDKLRGKLNDKRYSRVPSAYRQTKACGFTSEHSNKQLARKLTELKYIVNDKLTICQSNETPCTYKTDRKLQAAVEMLVLDIMSILGHSYKCLENNLHFIDENCPLLSGKCLRNHLAHDNAFMDILISTSLDPSLLVILNAKKLTEEQETIVRSKNTKISKLVNDDPGKLIEKFNQGLANINRQTAMFRALAEGNLESLKESLKQGADINARNIHSWSTLHFAAQGPSLEVVKYILDQCLSRDAIKDTSDGQSPLHVAAAHGRTHIVEFLAKEAAAVYHVNDLDNIDRTALHMAAQNGHKDTVEALLENRANVDVHDLKGMSALHHAIRNNHVDVTKMLLAKYANVDTNEAAGGYTPLHVAAGSGYLELVNFLLERKADIRARSDGDVTPLYLAALNGHLEVVRALILKGADVNASAIDGFTPLLSAVWCGHENIVNILLHHGANVNAADRTNNNTSLHYAAMRGHMGIVKILLKTGTTPLPFAAAYNHSEIATATFPSKHCVNIHTKNSRNATPFHCAVENGHKEMAELLLKYGAGVNDKLNNDLTPLHAAALNGCPGMVDLLLRNEARVEAEDIEGSTPLHEAAKSGGADVMELLIQMKGNVNARTSDEGVTPLHVAALNGHLAAIGVLIKNKADVNANAADGVTPLHLAAAKGHKDVVTLLIQNKAQLEVEVNEFGTALLIAVTAGRKDLVEILVGNGANVTCRNRSPLLSAIASNHKEITQILIDNGARVNTGGTEPLTLAALTGHREMAEMLLKNKAHVNTKGPENVTALHVAADRGHLGIVTALIERGADVDAPTVNNATPLYLAARQGYKEIVEILLTQGASVNGKENAEGTPLHKAAAFGHASVIKVLLDNGASIDVKDKENRTPLELAVARGHLQVFKMLLRHQVKLDDKGNFGMLHMASQGINLEIVKYLVQKGCDINAKDASGSKSIHIAARGGHRHTVAFFLSQGLSVNEPGNANQTLLHYAAAAGRLEVVRYLLSEGADVNAQDANGFSPIHFAAHFGLKDVTEVLLKNGAVYNAVDKLYRKPLEMAQDSGVINLLASTKKLFKAVKHQNSSAEVESCIKAGAFVNAKNAAGLTPLHYATWKGYEAVVNILLQNKADPNAAINDGSTPLHYAAKCSHLKVAMSLLCHGAVFNSVSGSGKRPFDLAADSTITGLFQLVSRSFENIKQGNSKVIDDLNRIKDVATLKAIMGARNEEGETLIVAAVRSNFSKLEQLKEVAQGDIAFQIKTAFWLRSQGNHQKALSILKSAHERRQEILGPLNPGSLDIQTYIAAVIYDQGFYEAALNALRDIFQKQLRLMGSNSKDTLNTRSFIALVLHKLEQNDKAFRIYQEVYQKQTEILGSEHSDTLATLLNMALVLDRQGKYEEALSATRTVFEKKKEILGANDPEAVIAQGNIAMLLANQGKYAEALQIYAVVYEKNKAIFGIHHCDTLRTLHNIAGVLYQQKNYTEALAGYQEVLNIQKIVLGPNHPHTINSLHNVANILFQQSKWIGALKAYREVCDRMKAVFGSSHPSVLDISQKLESIKMIFKLQGSNESEMLQHLQKEINRAASAGHTQALQRLLQDGADVNDRDIDGLTPLHYAIANRRLGIVNILLKAGADVTQVSNRGINTLHTAASKGHAEIVNVLLQHVVKRDKISDFVNAKSVASATAPLHIAAKSGYLEIVKSLLKHGAIYDIRDKESKVPLDFSNDQHVTDLLQLTQELFRDAKIGNVGIFSKLNDAKSDEFLALTNARDSQSNTLLRVVIVNKHKNIASKLLEMLKTKK